MPTYPYRCQDGACEYEFEVIKSMAEIDRPEICLRCAKPAQRYIGRTHFTGAADWNRQEWNPGLGCYTKGWKDAEKKAKSRGLEPIGNEKPETIHKHHEKARAEKWRKGWEAL